MEGQVDEYWFQESWWHGDRWMEWMNYIEMKEMPSPLFVQNMLATAVYGTHRRILGIIGTERKVLVESADVPVPKK